jgi:hypothetical protein
MEGATCEKGFGLSTYCLANGYDYGRLHGNGVDLPLLSHLEQKLIAQSTRFSHIYKLVGGQPALTGHIITFAHDGPVALSTVLPRQSLNGAFEVAFVGSKDDWRQLAGARGSEARATFLRTSSSVFQVRTNVIIRWLRMLSRMNDQSRHITIRDPDEAAMAAIADDLIDNARIYASEDAVTTEQRTRSNVARPGDPGMASVFLGPVPLRGQSDAQQQESLF